MTAFKGAFEALRNAVGDVDADRILTAVEAEACAEKDAEIDRLRAELAQTVEHRDYWHNELMCADARILELHRQIPKGGA